MRKPEDSSVDELDSDDISKELGHRDEAIKTGVIAELSTDEKKAKNFEETLDRVVQNRVKNSTVYDRFSATFFKDPVLETDLTKYGATEKTKPLFVGGFTAMLIAGPRMYNAQEEFKRKNQVTSFITKEAAQRQFSDKILYETVKFSGKLGLKAGFVTSGAFLLPVLLQIYNGRSTYFDHAIGYATSFGLYCIPKGPRAVLIGTLLPGMGGLIYGYCSRTFNVFKKTTYEDLYANHVREEMRMYRNTLKFDVAVES